MNNTTIKKQQKMDNKEITDFCENLSINAFKVLEYFYNNNEDFEADNFRFIEETRAFKEICESYLVDTYILGCFNSSFLSNSTNIDIEVIEVLQSTENFDVLGKLVLSYLDNDLTSLISDYIDADGYGHALGSYDGNNYEIKVNGLNYIVYQQ